MESLFEELKKKVSNPHFKHFEMMNEVENYMQQAYVLGLKEAENECEHRMRETNQTGYEDGFQAGYDQALEDYDI